VGKKAKKKLKKKLDKAMLKQLSAAKCKTNCCKKYNKGEAKRCKRCPCYDLL